MENVFRIVRSIRRDFLFGGKSDSVGDEKDGVGMVVAVEVVAAVMIVSSLVLMLK